MIKATTKVEREMLDSSKPNGRQRVNVPAGEYELVRILNPFGYDGTWLAIRDTAIGMAEDAWKQWIRDDPGDSRYGEYEIVLKEDGVLMPPLSEEITG